MIEGITPEQGTALNVPILTGAFEIDCERHVPLWTGIEATIAALLDKLLRTRAQTDQVVELFDIARATRDRFLDRYVDRIYDQITDKLTRFVRFDDILIQVAQIVPGLLPGSDTLSADAGRKLADKDGWERE
jgi:hypothetical protein